VRTIRRAALRAASSCRRPEAAARRIVPVRSRLLLNCLRRARAATQPVEHLLIVPVPLRASSVRLCVPCDSVVRTSSRELTRATAAARGEDVSRGVRCADPQRKNRGRRERGPLRAVRGAAGLRPAPGGVAIREIRAAMYSSAVRISRIVTPPAARSAAPRTASDGRRFFSCLHRACAVQLRLR